MESDEEEEKAFVPAKPKEDEVIIRGGKKGRGRRKQETVEIKGGFY